jgi:hypothetical protein
MRANYWFRYQLDFNPDHPPRGLPGALSVPLEGIGDALVYRDYRTGGAHRIGRMPL